VLSGVKVHSEDHGQGAPNIQEITSAEKAIAYLFEAAQNIGGILSALETSGAPVITPYAGFSVFVAAHINMYGTVSPRLYPGGQEKAEQEKSANFFYLERLCELWPVGNNWVCLVSCYPPIAMLIVNSGGLCKKPTDSMRQRGAIKRMLAHLTAQIPWP
jgi:hypothetical protein